VGGCGTRGRNVSASSVSQMSSSKRMTGSVPVRQCVQDSALWRHRSAIRRPPPAALRPRNAVSLGGSAGRLTISRRGSWLTGDLPVSRGAAAAPESARDASYSRYTTPHLPRLPLPPSPFGFVDDGAGGFRESLRWRGLFSSMVIMVRAAVSIHSGESCRFSSLSSLLKTGKAFHCCFPRVAWKEPSAKSPTIHSEILLSRWRFIKGSRIQLSMVNKH